jgi:hypothetical protein
VHAQRFGQVFAGETPEQWRVANPFDTVSFWRRVARRPGARAVAGAAGVTGEDAGDDGPGLMMLEVGRAARAGPDVCARQARRARRGPCGAERMFVRAGGAGLSGARRAAGPAHCAAMDGAQTIGARIVGVLLVTPTPAIPRTSGTLVPREVPVPVLVRTPAMATTYTWREGDGIFISRQRVQPHATTRQDKEMRLTVRGPWLGWGGRERGPQAPEIDELIDRELENGKGGLEVLAKVTLHTRSRVSARSRPVFRSGPGTCASPVCPAPGPPVCRSCAGVSGDCTPTRPCRRDAVGKALSRSLQDPVSVFS